MKRLMGMRAGGEPAGVLYWRLAAFGIAAVLSVLAWRWLAADHAKWLRYQHVYSRGVTTTATVLSYRYDPDGGDPGGWTTDRVAFVTSSGSQRRATVGHHNPGFEHLTRRLAVTYDPLHPDVVVAANADVSPTDGSEWWGGLLLAIPATVGAAALGMWTWLGFRRRAAPARSEQ